MSIFIGVDIGTTNVKVVAADESAAIVCEEKKSYPLYQPQQGWCEQDPEEIFAAFLLVFKNIIAKINPGDIETVCFSAAFHSVIAMDKDGNALTPVITWADTRSNAYAKQLKQSSSGKEIYSKTGVPIHPMSPLCKIAWIRDHQSKIFDATHKFISIKEFIWFKLFGEYEVDYSIASATGLFDIKTKVWCKEALTFCGITAELLSKPVSVFYSRTNPACTEFSLPPDVSFITGAGDGAMANLGSGAIFPGIAALTIGTSGAIRTVNTKPLEDDQGRLFNYLLTDELYISGGGINNGGIVLQWFLKTFIQKEISPDKEYEWFFEEIKQVPAGADGLIFLPYILGERAPVWDADAKGVFIGIKSTHTIKHFMRAVIEGICFSLLQLLNAIEERTPVTTIFATGGFTQSSLWLQMLSDILNKKIVVITDADASAMGTVYISMFKKGLISNWNKLNGFSHSEKEFLPDVNLIASYQKRFSVFNRLYDKLKDDFELLSNIEE
ncbi:MAG: gluconokinase [Chitinophagaceae bacterium]